MTAQPAEPEPEQGDEPAAPKSKKAKKKAGKKAAAKELQDAAGEDDEEAGKQAGEEEPADEEEPAEDQARAAIQRGPPSLNLSLYPIPNRPNALVFCVILSPRPGLYRRTR